MNSEEGHHVSHTTVGMLLKQIGFSLHMERVGTGSPDADQRSRHINDTVREYANSDDPVISIVCKKKENVDDLEEDGAGYAPKRHPETVLDLDLPLAEMGRAVPFGVYDIIYDEGYVNVGIREDTARSAVQTIRTWWREMGEERFPNAKRLYITADGGGSNGDICHLWKTELQDLANEVDLPIEVSHFPPGTYKWKKIEHRMFSQSSKDREARPLETLAIIVNVIASTTTEAGSHIRSGVDPNTYDTGAKVKDDALEKIQITKDDLHGGWNYIIYPSSTTQAGECIK